MNPFQFADTYLYPYKVKGNEIIPRECPYCHGGKHHDKKTFALNAQKLTFNCLRGSCGKKGTFNQLCKDFGETSDQQIAYERRQPVKKEYKKPEIKLEPISIQVKEYLKLRGISKKTWERRKISEHNGNIVFPYFENGELVLVKFKIPREQRVVNGKREIKSWREEGGKPVFWGMDDCDHSKPLVIVEGEIDALTLDECGIENVVSVPSGAQDLTCLENNWDWLQQFNKIIIWADDDKAGQEMERKLITRLGEWRCYVVRTPYKDANECLMKEGKEKIRQAIEQTQEVSIAGLIRLSDVKRIDYTTIMKVSSGFKDIDDILGGFMMGQITIWTGINSSGKSTLLGQILLNSIEQNFKVCAYSGELPASLFKYWIDLQVMGSNNLDRKFDDIKGADVPAFRKEVSHKVNKWYHDRFFLYDAINGVATDTDLFKVFEYVAKRYDCKIFMIDNLMTTMFTDGEKDFYRAQSKFISKVKEFAKKFDVHVHIVAHPRKVSGRLTKMDVAGSGDITNLADNVIAVHRLTKEEQDEEEYKGLDNVVQIFKNRINGVQDEEIGLKFEPFAKRFYQESSIEGPNKKYGWELNEVQDFFQIDEMMPWDGDQE